MASPSRPTSPPQPSTGLTLNLPSAAVPTSVPSLLACVPGSPGHLGPGMARNLRKEQLKLQTHSDSFRVDPRDPFWRGSLPRQEESWAGHLKAQPGPGFMGRWVALSASPSLSFSICNMGIFLLSQPLCLVRKTPLITGPSTQLYLLTTDLPQRAVAAQSLHCLQMSSSSSLLALALRPLCECFLLKNPTRSPQDWGTSQCSPMLRLRAEGPLESSVEMNGVTVLGGRAVGRRGSHVCVQPWCRGEWK